MKLRVGLRVQILLIAMALVGCGSDRQPASDAKVELDAMIDAGPDAPSDAPPDAPPLTLDCPTYCAEIQSNCTGANAQYTDAEHCLAACRSFSVGGSTVNDTSGNTLGCRIHHASTPSMMAPEVNCARAGPAGDSLTAASPAYCSGGDSCTSFCSLEIMACGTREAPLDGNPKDETGNSLYQYRDAENCTGLCREFDRAHAYSTVATGNSFACRLFHAGKAAIAVMPEGATHCASTAPDANRACVGPATP